MSSNNRRCVASCDRRLFIRSERHETPDLRKLSRALIALALAQAQAEAEAEAEHRKQKGEEDQPRAA